MSKKHNQCGDPTISAAARIAELERVVEQRNCIIHDLKKLLDANDRNVKDLTDENNHLRSMIRDGELNYAKLMGYVERIRDEQPPVMVPAQRESFLASAPDGTKGFRFGGRINQFGGRPEPMKAWFERG